MGTKAQELELMAKGEGCLGKAKADEPIFILRSQDLLSPGLVREWAARAHAHGCSISKVQEAYDLARRMEVWGANNPTKIPD